VAEGGDIGPFGPYRQSNRSELYAAEAARLLESGNAYHCWCTPQELDAVRREQEAAREAPRYNGFNLLFAHSAFQSSVWRSCSRQLMPGR
jgi:glutamyl-tRNA synthetase